MVQLKSLSLLAFAAGAIAETHTVTVGGDGDVFTPDTLTAAVGDVVTFNFKGEHSVASGDFKSPCKSSGSGTIFSGVMSSGQFSIQVNSTDPIWYYCSYAKHCQGGMAGVINAPSSGNSLDSYKQDASSSGSSSPPKALQNGVLGDGSTFKSSSSGSSSGSSGSASSTAAGSSSSGAAASSGSSGSGSSSATSGSGSSTASSTSSGTSSTASGSAGNKVTGFGIAGFAGVIAAIFA